MKSIKFNIENEFIIKKSKFITKLYFVTSEIEIKNILDENKTEYKDATHICYAYILNNVERFNDDSEPSGTAGIPILNVLKNNNLNNVLCIVIRYFGGIKLGAGGLIRAYCSSVSEALNKTEIINVVNGKKIELTFSYDDIKKVNHILNDINIVDKQFDENVKYIIIVKEKNVNSLINQLTELCNIKIKENTLIKD
jgi:uncharacterized YigZ family protein